MARNAWLNPRAILTGLTALCVACSLLPGSWTQLIGSLHSPMLTLLAPIQSPVRWAMVSLRGPQRTEASSEEVRQLQKNYDDAVQQLLQSRRQIDDLRRTIRELSRGADLAPDMRIRQIPAVAIIGPGSDVGALVNIKAGRREGVSEGAVAVLGGVHLVGRVRSIAEMRSAVQPLTDRAVGLIDAVITSEDLQFVAECQLESDGRGLFSGKVKESGETGGATSPADSIAPGMLVRLKDNSWPSAAQMLVVGKVERVESSAEMARRRIVIVRPEYTLARAAEVMLRMTDTSPTSPESGVRP
jgi:cell shape-determining protein MreC